MATITKVSAVKTVPKISPKVKNPDLGYTPTIAVVKKPAATPAVPAGSIPPASSFIPTSSGGTLPATPAPMDFSDYINEATTNPQYTSALDAFNASTATSRAGLGAQIANLIIQGGYDLTGKLTGPLQSYAGDITPEVLAAAKGNPLSQAAQIQQAYDQGLQDLTYQQAARGTLGSGAQATGASALLQQSQKANNDAQNQLMTALQGGVSNYENQQTAGQQNLNQILYNVASLLAQQEGPVYDVGDQSAGVQNTVPGTNIPSAKQGISWGGETGITTKQALINALAPGVSYAQWAANHPAAAATLR